MTTYLALLRAVNVAGKNKLPMADLRKALEVAGFERVKTYIQSGNIILDTPSTDATNLAQQISALILEQFGVTSPTIIRARSELASAIAANPYLADYPDDPTLHILFLAAEPSPEQLASLDPERSPGDTFSVVGRDVYLQFNQGIGRSKLTNAYFDARLQTVSTARNLKIANTLLVMMEESEAT